MRKRKGDQANPQQPNAADPAVDKTTAAGQPAPRTEAEKVESPALVPAQSEAPPAAPSIAPAPATPAAAAVDMPSIAKLADVRPGDAAPRPAETVPAAAPTPMRATRTLPLAASIALAAVVGAIAGSLATSGLSGVTVRPSPVHAASSEDVRALKESIVRINTEMVALKAAIDTSGKSTNVQYAKLGDRLDRFERAQVEPAAKLAKLTESIERLERRAAPTSTAATDTTATVAALAPPTLEPPRPAGPPVVEGWVLRGVYNGAALIQGRMGVIAVEPGDQLPGLGRIENIRRQDGRWVVVTSKGLIVTR